jgi:hypothetical protein
MSPVKPTTWSIPARRQRAWAGWWRYWIRYARRRSLSPPSVGDRILAGLAFQAGWRAAGRDARRQQQRVSRGGPHA